MYKIALLGRDISYTKSPAVHRAIAQAIGIEMRFDVLDIRPEGLSFTVDTLFDEYDGFFVTKPYKSEIAEFFGGTSPVNVVRCADKTAYNTDGPGFIRAADNNFSDWRERVNSALVLGTGGAAHSVVKALTDAGKKVYVLGRSNIKAARLATKYLGAELYTNQSAEMIVNCTPLGLNGEDALTALCVLPEFSYAFDLVCADALTPFLRRNRNNGAQACDGTDMLIYQAIEGERILFGGNFDVQDVYKKVVEILKSNGTFWG